MSILIHPTSFCTICNHSFAMGYHNCACGGYSIAYPTQIEEAESSYVSLVKRVGLDWKIEMHESRDKKKHLEYINSLRGNPNIEEAKVLQFNKVAGFTNVSTQSKNKGIEPDLDKIL